jgi:acetyltransferase-like isoleucine patch superfamily enzyme
VYVIREVWVSIFILSATECSQRDIGRGCLHKRPWSESQSLISSANPESDYSAKPLTIGREDWLGRGVTVLVVTVADKAIVELTR